LKPNKRSFFFQSHFRALSTALKLQLASRGSIDTKEEEIIPVWLRNLNLSRSQQWHITIQFELTYEAKWASMNEDSDFGMEDAEKYAHGPQRP
jgi:hypothetical protein